MKAPKILRAAGITFALLAVVFGALAAIPHTRERMMWAAASTFDSASLYESYLNAWPDGPRAAEARAQQDNLAWEQARKTRTIGALRNYESQYPNGAHAAEARELVEELVWREFSGLKSPTYINEYLNRYPKGKYTVQARELLEDYAWKEASGPGRTLKAVEKYAGAYPNGRYAAEVPALIDDIHWDIACRTAYLISGYREYLKKFPGGRYSAYARKQVEAIAWKEALQTKNPQDFAVYLGEFPAGPHAAEAREWYDDSLWKIAEGSRAIADLERYLEAIPGGRRSAEARARLAHVAWQDATKENTIRAYAEHLARHPESAFAEDARRRIAALTTDDKPCEIVLKTGYRRLAEQFLKDYPGHTRTNEVRQILAASDNARDIADLLDEGKIEVTGHGRDIRYFTAKIRRRATGPIGVAIPAGTYFVSADASVQNMIVTRPGSLVLTTDDWQEVNLDVACANRPRKIPAYGNTFTLGRSPQRDEFAKLMPVLENAKPSHATRQAAVWIVTDNANYAELGILQTQIQTHVRIPGQSQTRRSILEEQAVEAMKLCADAGIDITAKNIWRDRELIYRFLHKEHALAEWLREKL